MEGGEEEAKTPEGPEREEREEEEEEEEGEGVVVLEEALVGGVALKNRRMSREALTVPFLEEGGPPRGKLRVRGRARVRVPEGPGACLVRERRG